MSEHCGERLCVEQGRPEDAQELLAVLRQVGSETDNLTFGAEGPSTTVEQEDRVVLRDLQEQIEGEAHFVFSGQIVRGDMFYANPSLKKAQLRVPQLLQLSQEKQYDHAA